MRINHTKYTPAEILNQRDSDPVFRFIRQWYGDAPFIEAGTSGTTGKVEKIRFTRDQFLASARITAGYFNLVPGSKALLCLPVEYIAGKMMIARAIALDLHLITVPVDSAPAKHLAEDIDFAAMTPMQLQNSLQFPGKMPRIKTLITGGAPVSLQLRQNLQDIPTRIYETFGMTETLTHAAVKKLNHEGASEFFTVLPGFSIGQDDRGCLTIKADHIRNKHVVTNDLVELHTENSFKWLGRYDNLINSGGIKHVPEVIESLAAPFIPYPFFITGIPDEKLHQKIVLFIECSENETEKNTIINRIGNTLETKQMPKQVFFISRFIYTKTGKIDRKATMELVNRI